MNFLIIADDEFTARNVPIFQTDLLISCGDLPDEIILTVAEKCGSPEILAVKGNHDSSAPFHQPICDLHLVTRTIGGITFGGFSGAWKYKPRGNFLFDQGEVEKAMSTFPAVDVFVAHNSPRLIHDRDDEVHTGFIAFNHYISLASPKLFLHGHQHQNVESMVGSTRIIGTFGHRFLAWPS
jgi:Icc-related predicted phosphoesterase